MGESYLPHSVLHEKVLTLRKLFVHPTKGHAPGVVQTRQNAGFVRSLVKRVGTISNGVEHASAVRHHRLRQSHTRIQSITSLTRSQGGADGILR